jgi:TadE-like protein
LGQALAEFAIVAPIFFLLIFSIIQLGLLFGGQNAIVNAVRETARYASTFRVATSSDAGVVCGIPTTATTDNPGHYLVYHALARSVPGFQSSQASYVITYSWLQNPDGQGGAPGSYYVLINVKATYHYPLTVPLVSNILDGFDGSSDGRLTLAASESMRIENSALAAGFPQVTC